MKNKNEKQEGTLNREDYQQQVVRKLVKPASIKKEEETDPQILKREFRDKRIDELGLNTLKKDDSKDFIVALSSIGKLGDFIARATKENRLYQGMLDYQNSSITDDPTKAFKALIEHLGREAGRDLNNALVESHGDVGEELEKLGLSLDNHFVAKFSEVASRIHQKYYKLLEEKNITRPKPQDIHSVLTEVLTGDENYYDTYILTLKGFFFGDDIDLGEIEFSESQRNELKRSGIEDIDDFIRSIFIESEVDQSSNVKRYSNITFDIIKFAKLHANYLKEFHKFKLDLAEVINNSRNENRLQEDITALLNTICPKKELTNAEILKISELLFLFHNIKKTALFKDDRPIQDSYHYIAESWLSSRNDKNLVDIVTKLSFTSDEQNNQKNNDEFEMGKPKKVDFSHLTKTPSSRTIKTLGKQYPPLQNSLANPRRRSFVQGTQLDLQDSNRDHHLSGVVTPNKQSPFFPNRDVSKRRSKSVNMANEGLVHDISSALSGSKRTGYPTLKKANATRDLSAPIPKSPKADVLAATIKAKTEQPTFADYNNELAYLAFLQGKSWFELASSYSLKEDFIDLLLGEIGVNYNKKMIKHLFDLYDEFKDEFSRHKIDLQYSSRKVGSVLIDAITKEYQKSEKIKNYCDKIKSEYLTKSFADEENERDNGEESEEESHVSIDDLNCVASPSLENESSKTQSAALSQDYALYDTSTDPIAADVIAPMVFEQSPLRPLPDGLQDFYPANSHNKGQDKNKLSEIVVHRLVAEGFMEDPNYIELDNLVKELCSYVISISNNSVLSQKQGGVGRASGVSQRVNRLPFLEGIGKQSVGESTSSLAGRSNPRGNHFLMAAITGRSVQNHNQDGKNKKDNSTNVSSAQAEEVNEREKILNELKAFSGDDTNHTKFKEKIESYFAKGVFFEDIKKALKKTLKKGDEENLDEATFMTELQEICGYFKNGDEKKTESERYILITQGKRHDYTKRFDKLSNFLLNYFSASAARDKQLSEIQSLIVDLKELNLNSDLSETSDLVDSLETCDALSQDKKLLVTNSLIEQVQIMEEKEMLLRNEILPGDSQELIDTSNKRLLKIRDLKRLSVSLTADEKLFKINDLKKERAESGKLAEFFLTSAKDILKELVFTYAESEQFLLLLKNAFAPNLQKNEFKGILNFSSDDYGNQLVNFYKFILTNDENYLPKSESFNKRQYCIENQENLLAALNTKGNYHSLFYFILNPDKLYGRKGNNDVLNNGEGLKEIQDKLKELIVNSSYNLFFQKIFAKDIKNTIQKFVKIFAHDSAILALNDCDRGFVASIEKLAQSEDVTKEEIAKINASLEVFARQYSKHNQEEFRPKRLIDDLKGDVDEMIALLDSPDSTSNPSDKLDQIKGEINKKIEGFSKIILSSYQKDINPEELNKVIKYFEIKSYTTEEKQKLLLRTEINDLLQKIIPKSQKHIINGLLTINNGGKEDKRKSFFDVRDKISDAITTTITVISDNTANSIDGIEDASEHQVKQSDIELLYRKLERYIVELDAYKTPAEEDYDIEINEVRRILHKCLNYGRVFFDDFAELEDKIIKMQSDLLKLNDDPENSITKVRCLEIAQDLNLFVSSFDANQARLDSLQGHNSLDLIPRKIDFVEKKDHTKNSEVIKRLENLRKFRVGNYGDNDPVAKICFLTNNLYNYINETDLEKKVSFVRYQLSSLFQLYNEVLKDSPVVVSDLNTRLKELLTSSEFEVDSFKEQLAVIAEQYKTYFAHAFPEEITRAMQVHFFDIESVGASIYGLDDEKTKSESSALNIFYKANSRNLGGFDLSTNFVKDIYQSSLTKIFGNPDLIFGILHNIAFSESFNRSGLSIFIDYDDEYLHIKDKLTKLHDLFPQFFAAFHSDLIGFAAAVSDSKYFPISTKVEELSAGVESKQQESDVENRSFSSEWSVIFKNYLVKFLFTGDLFSTKPDRNNTFKEIFDMDLVFSQKYKGEEFSSPALKAKLYYLFGLEQTNVGNGKEAIKLLSLNCPESTGVVNLEDKIFANNLGQEDYFQNLIEILPHFNNAEMQICRNDFFNKLKLYADKNVDLMCLIDKFRHINDKGSWQENIANIRALAGELSDIAKELEENSNGMYLHILDNIIGNYYIVTENEAGKQALLVKDKAVDRKAVVQSVLGNSHSGSQRSSSDKGDVPTKTETADGILKNICESANINVSDINTASQIQIKSLIRTNTKLLTCRNYSELKKYNPFAGFFAKMTNVFEELKNIDPSLLNPFSDRGYTLELMSAYQAHFSKLMKKVFMNGLIAMQPGLSHYFDENGESKCHDHAFLEHMKKLGDTIKVSHKNAGSSVFDALKGALVKDVDNILNVYAEMYDGLKDGKVPCLLEVTFSHRSLSQRGQGSDWSLSYAVAPGSVVNIDKTDSRDFSTFLNSVSADDIEEITSLDQLKDVDFTRISSARFNWKQIMSNITIDGQATSDSVSIKKGQVFEDNEISYQVISMVDQYMVQCCENYSKSLYSVAEIENFKKFLENIASSLSFSHLKEENERYNKFEKVKDAIVELETEKIRLNKDKAAIEQRLSQANSFTNALFSFVYTESAEDKAKKELDERDLIEIESRLGRISKNLEKRNQEKRDNEEAHDQLSRDLGKDLPFNARCGDIMKKLKSFIEKKYKNPTEDTMVPSEISSLTTQPSHVESLDSRKLDPNLGSSRL